MVFKSMFTTNYPFSPNLVLVVGLDRLSYRLGRPQTHCSQGYILTHDPLFPIMPITLSLKIIYITLFFI